MTQKQTKPILKKLSMLKNIIFLAIGLWYYYVMEITLKHPIKKYLQKELNDKMLDIFSSFIFFIFLLGLLGTFIFIFQKILKIITKKTKTNIDNLIWDETIKFLCNIEYVISCYVPLYFVDLNDKAIEYIDKIFLAVLIFFTILFVIHIALVLYDNVILKHKKFGFLNKSLSVFIRKSIIVIIWIFGIMLILSNMGINITGLVAGAWIWGLAFAFAAQKSVANIFGAITILLNKPFVIWDLIAVNWVTWKVKDLSLTYITLIEQNGHQVMVPNETIISSNVENFSVRESRRSDFSLGLVYWTPLEQMKKWVEIVEEILETYKQKEEISSYRVNFDTFWDFSLNINATYFSLVKDDYQLFLKQREEINLKIKEQFEKAGLDMAFPTQELIMKKES